MSSLSSEAGHASHGVSWRPAAQQREAAVVLLAATLHLPQLLRALVVHQVKRLLSLTLVLHLRTRTCLLEVTSCLWLSDN